MNLMIKMAIRSLLRHKKRSIVNAILISTSTFVVFFAFTFCRTVNENMQEAVVGCATGDIQIHDSKQPDIDIYSTPPVETILFDSNQDLIDSLSNIKGVTAVSQRLRVQGLFTFKEKSTSSILTGIFPLYEKNILTGIHILEGENISKENGIILGKTLQEKLGINLGDTITYSITESNGNLTQVNFEVEGIFSAEGLDMYMGTYAFCNIDYLRAELGYLSEVTSEIVLRIDYQNDVDEMLNKINSGVGLSTYGLKAMKWSDIAETYSSIIQTMTIIPGIVSVCVIILVILGLVNNIYINFMERKKEQSTMSALGTSRGRLVFNFGCEYMVIGAWVAGITLIMSTIVIGILGTVGITTTSEIVAYIFGGNSLHLKFFGDIFIITFLLFVVVPAFVAIVISYVGTRRIDLAHLS